MIAIFVPSLLVLLCASCTAPSLHQRSGNVLDLRPKVRETLTRYFVRLHETHQNRIRGFACVTGEEEREAAQAAKTLLGSDEETVDGWFVLAFQNETTVLSACRTSASPPSARQIEDDKKVCFWARAAFNSAANGQSALDPRFMKAVRIRRHFLLGVANDYLRRNGRLPSGFESLFVSTSIWEAVPLYLDAVEKYDAPGWLCFNLSYLTWRDPQATGQWKLRNLEGEARRLWIREFRSWWKQNQNSMAAEAILKTAIRRELLGVNLTPNLDLRLLVHLTMEDSSTRSWSWHDMTQLLESQWPARRHCNETDETAPKEEPIALTFSCVRDAVFLTAYRREPDRAMRHMEVGLKLNDRVLGNLFDRVSASSDRKCHPDVMFGRWLSERLKRDIDSRLSDKSLDLGTRLKWLVIRDSFFPQKQTWLYDYCIKRDNGQFEVMRDKIRVMRVSQLLDDDSIQKALHERGY
jgi:hypothetical protein